MATQPLRTQEFLRSVWLLAYQDKVQVFNYTGQDHSNQRIVRLRAALYNYRRKIRFKKLDPDYTKEWTRLTMCELVVDSPTQISIHRVHALFFQRKLNKVRETIQLPSNLPQPLI